VICYRRVIHGEGARWLISTFRARRVDILVATNLYQARNDEQTTSPSSIGCAFYLPGLLRGSCGGDLDVNA